MEQGPPQEAGEQDGRADEYQRRERKNETGGKRQIAPVSKD